MNFSEKLLIWYNENKRPLAWRKTKDAYKIWLSEIIMQQTQIAQGTAYYHKFVKNYPTIHDLAKASEAQVLYHWQGLGYYTRARNLQATAKYISEKLNGKFPDTYVELRKLKGVGDYTASAIASFAFGKIHPAIDGNVQRVLTRIFGLHEAINTGASKKEISAVAEKIIDRNNPGIFNQAMMDFGSIHCKAKKPLCSLCPFKDECYAFRESKIDELPVKKKALEKQDRFMYYFIPLISEKSKNYTLINLRNKKGIWQNLYDFPLIEDKKAIPDKEIKESIKKQLDLSNKEAEIKEFPKEYKHILSHRTLYVKFYTIKPEKDNPMPNIYKKVFINELQNYPFPQLIRRFFNENDVSLFF